jgi:YD repeat-containing protein
MNEPEGSWLAHQHDAIGNLIQTNVGGVITTMSYDNRGNKVSMNDPDMGIWSYTYNARIAVDFASVKASVLFSDFVVEGVKIGGFGIRPTGCRGGLV